MFKNHPKGLLTAALSNMGERFGYYIMNAVLVLFLCSKFGLSEAASGTIYSFFYAGIYILSLVGGLIADRTQNYKGTIKTGLVVMAIGYIILSVPILATSQNTTWLLTLTCVALFLIAFGNGLFKGNLQALVGQMYDDPKYSSLRDSGFQIFYMFINIGGFFAPWIAIGVRNWWLKVNNFDYDATLPELCHQFLKEGDKMAPQAMENLASLADKVTLDGSHVADMGTFVNNYLDVFNRGFQYAFMAAIVAMLISLVIYLANKNRFPDPAKKVVAAKEQNATVSKEEIKMSAAEIKQRIYALFAVFGVVIFFWLSFHQNGYSLTYFARDYVDLSVIDIDLGFTRIKGAEIFQCVNPFFVVFLTPFIMWFFGALKKKEKEPSTPMKIAIGMGIAALAYIFLMVFSFTLPAKDALSTMSAAEINAIRVTPWIMIGLYFILTVAELYISPLGISFVSKVAPPKYQGIMQGGWLGATAIGNQLLFIGAVLYETIPIWMTWTVFVVACSISMITMLFMLKWLERVAK